MIIDLNDNIGDSKFFAWREALFLPQWDVYAFPKDVNIMENIIKTAKKMDKIRELFNRPVTITSWYRPARYNKLIGGASQSAHISGLGCDFMVQNMKSADARKALFNDLSKIDIRMESLNTPHVHIDLKCTPEMDNNKRYFKP